MKNILYKEVKSFEDLKRIAEFEKTRERTIWLKSHKYPVQPDKIWLDDPLSRLIYDNQDIFLQIEKAIGKENMQAFCLLLIEFGNSLKTRADLEVFRDVVKKFFAEKRVTHDFASLRAWIRSSGLKKTA